MADAPSRGGAAIRAWGAGCRTGRCPPLRGAAKKQVTLRLDADVIAKFRESGPGWQSRMNEALRKAAGL
ncbi:MAG TPA: BrnA antitoxin family protein [Sphingobium sp.]|nr:BrnA antitoxin family protein [Sphingobium sp.]